MNKLDLNPTPLTFPADVKIDVACNRRLLVLIPPGTDYSMTMRRIWELAHATGMNVQLLGLCKDATEESGLRRGLTAMASLLQDGQIAANAKVDIGTNWLHIVRTNYQEGDVIVCFAEQRTGLWRRPLSQILESNLKATVYILSGLTPQKSNSSNFLQISAWLGSIAIVISFGILQARVVQLPEGWLQSILFLLLIVPEFWLIWSWNSLFE
jgi:hypothetical protein